MNEQKQENQEEKTFSGRWIELIESISKNIPSFPSSLYFQSFLPIGKRIRPDMMAFPVSILTATSQITSS